MKRIVVLILKIGVSLAILGYLIMDAHQNKVFEQLRDQPKQWDRLGAAWAVGASAVVLTMIRWCYLARAIGIPLTLRNAFRLGFLGYLFNLAPMGVVGGDALKTVMLARETKTRFGKAFASVAVDRLIGLYFLFVVSTIAIFWSGIWRNSAKDVGIVCQFSIWAAIGGAIAIGLVFIPWFTEGHWVRQLTHHPRYGRYFAGMVESFWIYRRKPGVLAVSALMSVAVHVLSSTGVYLIACGLPGDVLDWPSQLVAAPLAMAGSVVPLPMGPFEWILDLLYATLPLANGEFLLRGQGLVVALGYRINSLLTATIGICYYFGARAEVQELVHEQEMHDQPLSREGAAFLADSCSRH